MPDRLLGEQEFRALRERAGVAIAIARDGGRPPYCFVAARCRTSSAAPFQQTPDHGAEMVRVILEDKELRAEWEAELT